MATEGDSMNGISKRGFSLIELLITMAIAGILFVLILLSLSVNQNSSKRVRCNGNMRKIAIAGEACIADNRTI